MDKQQRETRTITEFKAQKLFSEAKDYIGNTLHLILICSQVYKTENSFQTY